MLDLLYLLVKYGYYDDIRDINELIPPLVSLLNGKNDKPHPEANSAVSESFMNVRLHHCLPFIMYWAFRQEDLKIIV